MAKNICADNFVSREEFDLLKKELNAIQNSQPVINHQIQTHLQNHQDTLKCLIDKVQEFEIRFDTLMRVFNNRIPPQMKDASANTIIPEDRGKHQTVNMSHLAADMPNNKVANIPVVTIGKDVQTSIQPTNSSTVNQKPDNVPSSLILNCSSAVEEKPGNVPVVKENNCEIKEKTSKANPSKENSPNRSIDIDKEIISSSTNLFTEITSGKGGGNWKFEPLQSDDDWLSIRDGIDGTFLIGNLQLPPKYGNMKLGVIIQSVDKNQFLVRLKGIGALPDKYRLCLMLCMKPDKGQCTMFQHYFDDFGDKSSLSFGQPDKFYIPLDKFKDLKRLNMLFQIRLL